LEITDKIHIPAISPPGKSVFYTLNRRLGETQSRSENIGGGKVLTAAGNQTAVGPAHGHVSIPTKFNFMINTNQQ
jgi:hypothetical protein